MTSRCRQELVQEAEPGTAGTCEQRTIQMSSWARPWLPPADSAIRIPAWDPSGEALAEVADPGSDRIAGYWMQFENDMWLVAGRER